MHTHHPLRASLRALASGWLALAAAIGLRAQAYTWRNVQIHGGGFTPGIIFHPTTPNLMYVRTDVGGAYRWDNTNSVWVPLNDNLNFSDNELAGVLSLAVDPNNANLLYLACGMYTASWARNAAI